MESIFPGVDPFYDELKSGNCYDLFGIINCTIEIKNLTEKGLLLYRVPLLLGIDGNHSQVIIEVWAAKGKEEPIFTRNWLQFQIAYIREAKFVAKRERFGLTFFHFTLSTNPSSRYIWLSSDEPNFWRFPIADPEPRKLNSFKKKLTGEYCPFDGEVKSSPGSVFGSLWTLQNKKLHSRTMIGHFSFSHLYAVVLGMKEECISSAGKLVLSDHKALMNITRGHFFMQKLVI